MRIKLSLGELGAERDVQVTLDATASIGDLAERLAAVSSSSLSGELTLRSHGLPTAARTEPSALLDRHVPVSESPLRSGVRVTLAEVGPGARRSAVESAAASLRIVEGPDKGREFPIPFGSSVVGREVDCDVVLRDGFVSKRHLRIAVTHHVEVVDLGSANGVLLDGVAVQRAVIRPEDRITIGDTTLAVVPLGGLAADGTASVAFNRRPLVDPWFEGRELEAPETPQPGHGMRFPVVAMVAPLLLGLVMFAVTRSPQTVIFVALSPLLMVGSFFDQRRQTKSEEKRARKEFEESLATLRHELGALQVVERESRLQEHPSTAEATEAVEELSSLLWLRRPDRPGFLDLRLGLGAAASRTTLRLPDRRQATAADWAALTGLAADFASVPGVPIVASLREAGGVGVAGQDAVMCGVARGLIVQLIGFHSPAELSIVAVGSSASAAPWNWLKWVPHVGSAHSPLAGTPLANNAGNALRLVAQVEELIESRLGGGETGSGEGTSPLPALVVVVLDDAPVERSRLVQIAETGPRAGVHVLWCAGSTARIPAACRAFVELAPDGAGDVGLVHTRLAVDPVVCEYVGDDVALHVSRRLSPILDAGARVVDDSDLPRSVSFLTAMGTDIGRQPEAVVDRWRQSDPTLAGERPRKANLPLHALVGQGSADQFILDLRVHGPHALVGGTTGSGKSEFLQSWVLGMAATQSPRRITFLFVDYKGGSAFASCTDLPHCVGLVTDLSPHLVRRALTSLRAELTFREHHLRRYDAKDLIELEHMPEAEQLPSLVIVVDEFAALAQEVPDFITGVIDVAQRGRSLGLHLVLATQRPAGLITGSLRANTNLRVALRMADADDSTDVLGEPTAAGFDPGTPGRAAAKTGPGRVTPFQSLYVGGETPDVPPAPEIAVESLIFGQGESLEPPVQSARPEAIVVEERKDIDKVVEQIGMAHRILEIPVPRKPWLDTLAPVYDWRLLSQRTDSALVIGVEDRPHEQSNDNVYFRPDDDGNMLIFGTGGTGKSTLLRTLAASAALTPRSGPCDVYALDFGSRGLAMLEEMPHVGAVISGGDHERVARLLRWLRDEAELRARKYAAARAGNITEYRAASGVVAEKRLLVLVDGFPAFREEYELGPRSAWFSVFNQLAADGRALGIHFVMTADRPSSVPPSLTATVQRRMTLRLAQADDYGMVGEPADILDADSPPGRGIMGGHEVQVGVVGGSANLSDQSAGTARLAASIARQDRAPARGVDRLAERVLLSELSAARPGHLWLGVGDDDLQPFQISAEGSFLVVGPPASGRTTTVATVVRSFLTSYPDAPHHLFTSPRSRLRGLTGWTGTATDEESATALAMKLEQDVRDAGGGPGLIVLEALEGWSGGGADAMLESMVKVAVDHGLFVLAEGETSAVGQAWGLAQPFKLARRGIALQPEDTDGTSVFRTNFPRMTRSEFPPGRGVVVDAGSILRVQMCLPE